MERRAFRRAAGLAAILQMAVVLLELAFPSLAQANLYPILGTLAAVLAGWLFAYWTPRGPLKLALVGGGSAGGVSSFLAVLLAALTGQASPGPLSTILVATVTGTLAGAVGGFLGRLFAGERAVA